MAARCRILAHKSRIDKALTLAKAINYTDEADQLSMMAEAITVAA